MAEKQSKIRSVLFIALLWLAAIALIYLVIVKVRLLIDFFK